VAFQRLPHLPKRFHQHVDLQQLDLPPPRNWQDFQNLCHALWEREWNCPTIQQNGRPGQKQRGVDIFGRPNGGDRFHGIQCKLKSADGTRPPVLTQTEVEHEVAEAKTFTPPLEHLIVATTAPQDAHIQAFARQLSARHAEVGLFKVDVLAWPELKARLAKHEAILGRFYPSASATTVRIDEGVSAIREMVEQLSIYRFPVFTLVGTLVVLVTIWIALWVALQGDRAFVSISAVEFDPPVPLADKRVRIAITLKNSGRSYAKIEGMATDRKNELPAVPKYEVANITPVDIPVGEELRIISDVGVVPLVFTQHELDSLKNEEKSFRIVGFVEYSSGILRWAIF